MKKRSKSQTKSKPKTSPARAPASARARKTRSETGHAKTGHETARASKARSKRKPVGRDHLDAFVDAASHAIGLPIERAWRAAIKSNLEITFRLAASFADFSLPDDAEPAPVFVA